MHDGGDSLDYEFSVNETERESNAKKFLSPSLYNFHKKGNTFLNIIFCLIVLWSLDFQIFSGWNIVILGISFVLFDIVVGFIDNFLFHIKPNLKVRRLEDINELQKYVKFLEEKYNDTAKKAEKHFKEECAHCDYRHWYDSLNRYGCGISSKCLTIKEFEYWKDLYKTYKKKLDDMLEEIETQKAVDNTKVSAEYQNKVDYFKDLKKKYSHYMKNEKYGDLKSVVKSLKKLIALLEKKPMGLSFIPNTVYIYLDELQSIFTTLEGLDEEKQNRYSEMVNKISVALSDNIERINKRIDEYEVGDLEVSLNVLYQELVKEEETDV